MIATQSNDVTITPGLIMAPVTDAHLVFDAVAQRGHTLVGLAAWVLTGPTHISRAELIDQLCADSSATPDDARRALDEVIASLADLGLIGRDEPGLAMSFSARPSPPPNPAGPSGPPTPISTGHSRSAVPTPTSSNTSTRSSAPQVTAT